MKKILSFMMMLIMSVTLVAGCKKDDGKSDGDGCSAVGGDMTLKDINDYLNDDTVANMEFGNVVAVIPFNHINGPREEWKFFALVNFMYKELTENYVKYQVTFLSCTCRSANVNYWSTAYVELTIPDSGSADDAVLRKLSFDKDGTEHYTAGYWGDSNPIYSGDEIVATYEKTPINPDDLSQGYYPSIREDYIPLLVGKTKAQIDTYNVMDDMKTNGVMTEEMFDSFTGASVSTNNILRILHALFKYHGERYLG